MKRLFIISLAAGACSVLLLCAGAAVTAPREAEPSRQNSIQDPRLQALEPGLMEVMRRAGVPGLSLAVFENGKIVHVRGYGVKHIERDDAVDTETVFSAGSISKVITATLVMRLQEQGRLDIDRPIQSYLRSWQPDIPDAWQQDTISLKRLLSHTAGVNVHGFNDYYPGKDIPTLQEVLDGSGPARNPAIRVVTRPGSAHRYSGGGYVIVQRALEDWFQSSFAELADKYLFAPAGMANSTFLQPGEPGFPDNAARAHVGGRMAGSGLPFSPERSAAGLYTTAEDLAVLILAVQEALAGNRPGIMSERQARQMLSIQKDQRAIGWLIREKAGRMTFSHGGQNQGTGGFVLGFMEGGDGFAVLSNGHNGSDVVSWIFPALVQALSWEAPAEAGVSALH